MITEKTVVRVPEFSGVPEFYGEVAHVVSDTVVHVRRYVDGLVFERPTEILEEVE